VDWWIALARPNGYRVCNIPLGTPKIKSREVVKVTWVVVTWVVMTWLVMTWSRGEERQAGQTDSIPIQLSMAHSLAVALVLVLAYFSLQAKGQPHRDWQYGTWFQGIDNGNCAYGGIAAPGTPTPYPASSLRSLIVRYQVARSLSPPQHPTSPTTTTWLHAANASNSSASTPTRPPPSRSPTAALQSNTHSALAHPPCNALRNIFLCACGWYPLRRWCSGDIVHFDLSPQAFAAIAFGNSAAGMINTQYRPVTCPSWVLWP
jgi:hypothetical protein